MVIINFAVIWGAVWPILIAILAFLFLIFIHELGHFIAAKATGVRVNEFAIGFGPKILKIQGKQTLYSVRLLPLGGFCAMEGEDEDSDDPDGFCNKSVWRRFIITAAGAAFNLLFGFVLIMVLLSPSDRYATTTVAQFKEGAISSQTGLQIGDTILSVNGRRVLTTSDLGYTFTNIKTDGNVNMTVERRGEKVKLENVKFESETVEGITYLDWDFYVEGIDKNVGTFLSQSVKTAVSYSKMIWWSLIDLVTGKYGISAISGPVGVTVALGEAVKQSVWDLISMLALLTINLGIFNLLPLPALDGGRILFLIIEAIRRKPIPQKYEGVIHGIGLAILLAISGIVLIKDIFTLF